MLFRILILLVIVLPNVSFSQTQPNIVFIIVDDLGRQDLSLYGSKFYQTPNIDSLASEGMRFDHAYAAHPRCVPSRYAIFSGQYPASNSIPGINGESSSANTLALDKVTFAEQLKAAGYRTGYIGKWHLGQDDGGGPEFQGFDYSYMAGHAGQPHSYFFPFDKTRKGKVKRDFVAHKDGKPGDYLTDILAQNAQQFIENNASKPFMLVLAHYSVHTPIEAPKALTEKYQQIRQQLGLIAGGIKSADDAVIDRSGQVKTVQNNAEYAAMIEKVDNSVGRVLATVERLEIDDNTIIILTSDHGGLSSRGVSSQRELATSNAPFRHGKGWLFDGGLRVPLIVKWPGVVTANSKSNVQVTGTDHYPTILSMANLPLTPEHHRDGVSYRAALNKAKYQRQPMFWHSPMARPNSTGDTNASAIISGNWKLLDWYGQNLVELYDLHKDHGEKNNIAKQNPFITRQLKTQLDRWRVNNNVWYDTDINK